MIESQRPIDELFGLGVAGDGDAWAELVDRLSPAIWAVARNHGLSRDHAEDLAQTVWLRLVDHAASIREPSRLAGWVRTTARNEAVAILRRNGRDRPIDPADLVESHPRDGRTEGADEDAHRRRSYSMLLEGLATLDEPCRFLLRLVAHKISYRDIADHLDMKVGSIGPSRERCLTKLRSAPSIRQLIEERL